MITDVFCLLSCPTQVHTLWNILELPVRVKLRGYNVMRTKMKTVVDESLQKLQSC